MTFFRDCVLELVTETAEKKLIQGCRDGNRKAQKTVYDMFAGKMLSVCLRYVSDRSAAEDVLQDGFVALFSKLDSYKGDGSFEGWARRIFVNTALMYLRKKDALKMSEEIETAYSLSSNTSSQIEDIGYKELMKLIGELPAGFRTVFNMYVIEGYTHKEIADSLGITETTSRTQLSRARIWLQEKIQGNR